MLNRILIRNMSVVACMLAFTVSAMAHEMTIKGTVTAVEASKVQIKTGEEKKGEAPAWYPLDGKTKVLRGKNVISLEQAKIAVGERVVAIVNHESDGTMKTLELRLAAK